MASKSKKSFTNNLSTPAMAFLTIPQPPDDTDSADDTSDPTQVVAEPEPENKAEVLSQEPPVVEQTPVVPVSQSPVNTADSPAKPARRTPKKTERISTVFTPELKQRIEHQADIRGISVNTFITQALLYALKNKYEKEDVDFN